MCFIYTLVYVCAHMCAGAHVGQKRNIPHMFLQVKVLIIVIN